MTIHVDLDKNGYDIVIARGALSRVGELINMKRKVLVVTDDGVPSEYAEKVASFSENATVVTLPQGEESKNIGNFEKLLSAMLEAGFTRHDAVIAVGGGVVGDLSGFAAACFMRGIDFYNIPTTLLSQVDSSIGGKTAIDFHGVKNIVGAFYQPKKVIIDPDTLKTLDRRKIAAGMAEAIKMALTFERELFEFFESADMYEHIDTIIERALLIKKRVVECDEKEAGLRKVLNFGHTLGHGIESALAPTLYHGECVALGMLPMCTEDVRERLIKVLSRAGLATDCTLDIDAAMEAVRHDKKGASYGVDAVTVDTVGEYKIEKMSFSELEARARYFAKG